MNINDRKGLKAEAAHQLSRASYNPNRLMLIYTGVSLGAWLLAAVISFFLQQKIGTTGGLSGIGLRSVLGTIQSFLQFAISLLTPFWAVGIVSASIRLARGQTAEPKALLEGFRRWGPVMRLKILQVLICIALVFPCWYASIILFTIPPVGNLFVNLIPDSAILGMFTDVELPDPPIGAFMVFMIVKMIPLFLLVYLVVLLPILYRFRLAEYVILDNENCGARESLSASWRMTRGNAFSLFKLDLSFWWFYALQALLSVLAYGDILLPWAGISLPFSADVAYFLFYVVYVILELALFWRWGARLHTTYAVAYDALREYWSTPEPSIFSDEVE